MKSILIFSSFKFCLQLSEIIEKILSGDGNDFKSFDFTLDGDFSVGPLDTTFFELNGGFDLGGFIQLDLSKF